METQGRRRFANLPRPRSPTLGSVILGSVPADDALSEVQLPSRAVEAAHNLLGELMKGELLRVFR